MAVQRDEAWLKTATPEQIAAAEEAGELDALQGRVVRTFPEVGSIPGLQREREWIDAATPDRLAAAYEAGELDAYLGRVPWPQKEPAAKPAQGIYGDGSIVTHPETPRGDIPRETGPATVIGHGTDPIDLAARIAKVFSQTKDA